MAAEIAMRAITGPKMRMECVERLSEINAVYLPESSTSDRAPHDVRACVCVWPVFILASHLIGKTSEKLFANQF